MVELLIPSASQASEISFRNDLKSVGLGLVSCHLRKIASEISQTRPVLLPAFGGSTWLAAGRV